ncbi:NADH:ubiquinone oxidoreductase [Tulasnella sp. 424]|nr:NADH:ubiquinone oxidoreductase [Tulasnella sp. 424]KAG8961408.1 NADH:ubiquinone oxidoreductase [Tulasnella sp. 425]
MEQNIEVLTLTMVKEVKDKTVVVKNDKGQVEELPFRLLAWAAGNCTATSYAPTGQVATQEGRYLACLLSQLAKKEAPEKKLAELRGESSGLAEGPEGKARHNAEEIESIRNQLNKASKIRPFHYSHCMSLFPPELYYFSLLGSYLFSACLMFAHDNIHIFNVDLSDRAMLGT